MKKLFITFILVLVFISTVYSDDGKSSQFFQEGANLYNAGKFVEAMLAWKKAVEEGNGRAASLIGFLYETGANGIEKNTANALKWYTKARDMNYPGANIFLAYFYANGTEVSQDFSIAYRLVREVENINLPSDDVIPKNACQFYIYGWGTPVDLHRASEIASRISDIREREKTLQIIKEYEKSFIPIQAKVLIDEMNKNQLRFDKQFKNKPIVCEGFVGRIQEIRDGYALQIWDEEFLSGPFSYVDCRFTHAQENPLLALNKGELIRVIGSYKGRQDFQSGTFTLFECSIIKVNTK